jgi:hypothetical protein
LAVTLGRVQVRLTVNRHELLHHRDALAPEICNLGQIRLDLALSRVDLVRDSVGRFFHGR